MKKKTICTLHGFLGLTGEPCPHCKTVKGDVDLRAELAAAQEENAALESRVEEAERRIAELQSEVACEERRFNAQYDLLAEVSKRADDLAARLAEAEKRAEDAAVFLQDEIKKAADWYTAYCEVKEEFDCLESSLRESEGREAVLADGFGRIINTVAYLQKEADKEGNKLNGLEAINLSRDANFLKQLAENTISTLPTRTAAVLAVLDAALAFHDVPTNNEKAERFSKACHKYKEV